MKWNGRLYEALASWHEHRSACDLYHAALEVTLSGTRHVIEMGPVWNEQDPARGVVLEGPVGLRALGRFRAFRYEVRCWSGGRIPDVAEAVDSPLQVSRDEASAAVVLGAVRTAPALTWGRDELGAGEMWNSNSLVAWLLACAGLAPDRLSPPRGGRAPGWRAGLVLRDQQATQQAPQ